MIVIKFSFGVVIHDGWTGFDAARRQISCFPTGAALTSHNHTRRGCDLLHCYCESSDTIYCPRLRVAVHTNTTVCWCFYMPRKFTTLLRRCGAEKVARCYGWLYAQTCKTWSDYNKKNIDVKYKTLSIIKFTPNMRSLSLVYFLILTEKTSSLDLETFKNNKGTLNAF